ncbi:MAG: hypothetical protein QM804_16220 [Propionicimonas sp.]
MATERRDAKSPFTRPGFIIATIVIALVAVTSGCVDQADHHPKDAAPPSTSSSPSSAASSPTASTPSEGASICGLSGEVMSGTLPTAPNATWAYQVVTAYPTSPEYGPADTTPGGVRFCFQRSPEGALFMAANALVQGSDPAIAEEWVNYVVAEGPHRTTLIADIGRGSSGDGTRAAIVGFRLLAYDGESARVDLAARITAQGRTVTVSGVYELVWQGGDWKISADIAQPLNIAQIPDTLGYVEWGD